jgi:uncharacterized RDD family membrane protein YckC
MDNQQLPPPTSPIFAYPPTNTLNGAVPTPAAPMRAYPFGHLPPHMLGGYRPDYEYASLRRRRWALTFDGVLTLIGGVILLILLDRLAGIRLFVWEPYSATPRISFSAWPMALVSLAYAIPMVATGGTIGKRMLGLRVTNERGEEPGFQRSILRVSILAVSQLFGPLVIGLIDLIHRGDPDFQKAVAIGIVIIGITIGASLIELLGCVSANWDDHKQALHDKIAGTYVIHKLG